MAAPLGSGIPALKPPRRPGDYDGGVAPKGQILRWLRSRIQKKWKARRMGQAGDPPRLPRHRFSRTRRHFPCTNARIALRVSGP